jgi:K+-sensing histidine kinase KdpD
MMLLIVGWSLVVVGLVGLAAWAVTRAALRPLVTLIQGMNPASERVRPGAGESPPRTPLEVRLLRGVIADRERARRLAASQRALYVSTLIHDMKTPLLAVGRSLAVALDEANEQRRRMWLEASIAETQRLLALVQDVVDAERLESGMLELRWAPVDVAGLLRRVLERVSHTREDVTLRMSGKPNPSQHGDPDLLERAIENVVANAAQYARSSVDVEIMAGLVRVVDDGPGLSTDSDRIGLDVPARTAIVSPARSARRPSGLGLLIARRVLEAHGGRMVVEASNESGTALLLYLGTSPGPRVVT